MAGADHVAGPPPASQHTAFDLLQMHQPDKAWGRKAEQPWPRPAVVLIIRHVEPHKTAADIRAQLVETRERLKRELAALEAPSGALGAYGGMNSPLLHAELRGELAEVERRLARLDAAVAAPKVVLASPPPAAEAGTVDAVAKADYAPTSAAPQVIEAPRTVPGAYRRDRDPGCGGVRALRRRPLVRVPLWGSIDVLAAGPVGVGTGRFGALSGLRPDPIGCRRSGSRYHAAGSPRRNHVPMPNAADLPDRHPPRRDFIRIAALTAAAGGLALLAWPLIDQMNPAANVVDPRVKYDLRTVASGEHVMILWRRVPVVIWHRTAEAIAAAERDDTAPMRYPEADDRRVKVGHRQWLIVVGACTWDHCTVDPHPSEFMGWVCPCCGARCDASGRACNGPPDRGPLRTLKNSGGTQLRVPRRGHRAHPLTRLTYASGRERSSRHFPKAVAANVGSGG